MTSCPADVERDALVDFVLEQFVEIDVRSDRTPSTARSSSPTLILASSEGDCGTTSVIFNLPEDS